METETHNIMHLCTICSSPR